VLKEFGRAHVKHVSSERCEDNERRFLSLCLANIVDLSTFEEPI
jgi:hypothetical protein